MNLDRLQGASHHAPFTVSVSTPTAKELSVPEHDNNDRLPIPEQQEGAPVTAAESEEDLSAIEDFPPPREGMLWGSEEMERYLNDRMTALLQYAGCRRRLLAQQNKWRP
jgi:hypothetical protein